MDLIHGLLDACNLAMRAEGRRHGCSVRAPEQVILDQRTALAARRLEVPRQVDWTAHLQHERVVVTSARSMALLAQS